jgi:beta-lactamase superfamily II metal-dependent hydrolase
MRRNKLTLGLIAALLALYAGPALAANGVLEAWFIDVGQGDSTFISTPKGHTVLVDAGPPPAGGRVARFLREHTHGPVDVTIATHPHVDHVGGMSAALRAVGTRRYIDVAPEGGRYNRVLATLDKTVAASGAAHSHADQSTAPIDLGDGTTITFLSPVHPSPERCRDQVNCDSIAILVRNGPDALIVAADIEGGVENELLRRHKGALKVQVLKVAHHGSNSATTTAWLRTLKPSLAVISCGAGNSYHHPHPSTVHRLEAEDVPTLRTDQVGTIHVALSGGQTSVVGTDHEPSPPQATPSRRHYREARW